MSLTLYVSPVPKAGEMLYRLRKPPAWQVWKD